MSQQDMTWQEVRDSLKGLHERVGGYPNITLDVTPDGLRGYVRIGADGKLIRGESLSAVVDGIAAETEKQLLERDAKIIRDMAVAIIRITADIGYCNAAALTVDRQFSPEAVKRHGAAACDEANRMAEAGPFEIVATSSNQVAA